MRIAAIGAYALLITLLASCMVTPKRVGVRGKITDPALAFLQEGKTPRDDVLMHLGLPDQADQQERWFIYEWATAWDVYGYNSYTEVRSEFILLVEFDGQGIVSYVKKRKGGIDRLDREFLAEGITHRNDILLHMGLPDQCDKQGKRFVYGNSYLDPFKWEELRRFVGDNDILWDLILSTDEIQEIFEASIEIEFDDQGFVSSIEKPDDIKVPISKERTLEDLHKLFCGEYAGSLSESNFYTNQQEGFSIQFPSKWSTTCKGAPAIIEVEKLVYTGFGRIIRLDPDYHLKLWIETHPSPGNSDIWDLTQLPKPKANAKCPNPCICNETIEAVDSGKIRFDGIHAVREVHRIERITQLRRFYQLYKLGKERFENQPYDHSEDHLQSQLLTYWFLQNGTLYQVTGGFYAWDESRDRFEKAADEWQPILEKSIRSFRFIN